MKRNRKKQFDFFIVLEGGKRVKNPRGWLLKFIEEKANGYIAPVRKGTPKGDPIGFPITKYKASILSLAALSFKDIANASDVSYALLLKWRGEDAFKKQVQANIDEFSEWFIEKMWKKFKGKVPGYVETESLDLSQIFWYPELLKELEEDFPYSPFLEKEILEKMIKKTDEEKSKAEFLYMAMDLLTFWRLRTSKDKNSSERILRERLGGKAKILGVLHQNLSKEISNIVKNEDISGKEKTEVVNRLLATLQNIVRNFVYMTSPRE